MTLSLSGDLFQLHSFAFMFPVMTHLGFGWLQLWTLIRCFTFRHYYSSVKMWECLLPTNKSYHKFFAQQQKQFHFNLLTDPISFRKLSRILHTLEAPSAAQCQYLTILKQANHSVEWITNKEKWSLSTIPLPACPPFRISNIILQSWFVVKRCGYSTVLFSSPKEAIAHLGEHWDVVSKPNHHI